jgi:hypothetical protein
MIEVENIINIGDRRELFVDKTLIDRMDNVWLQLHEPRPGGTAICIDQPWEGPANGPLTVFPFEGRYLMYYRAMMLKPDDESGVLCVALSENGVVWRKPGLDLVGSNGRGDTNICADDRGLAFMATPWLDTCPNVPAGERIKAITSETIGGEKHTAFADPKGPKRLVFWVSADGFTFRRLHPQPELVSDLPNCFDGGNTMFWSEVEEQYVLYYRIFDNDGGTNYRSMARTTSKDLMQWTDSIPMTFGDTPREQFYTNQTQPYYRAPHIYIAPAARFMEGRRVLTVAQAEEIGLRNSRGNFYDNDCSDGVLLTTRAGSTQYDRTFMETFIRPGPSASNWVSRTNYPVTGILHTSPEEMTLFVARHYMQESWHVERLQLRTDGFASVRAPWAGGEMISKPLTFAGDELEINYRSSAAGSVRVELQHADGKPLAGFSTEHCQEIIGDEMERVVVWKHGAGVGRLAGQPIRLRFSLRDADLYSFRTRIGGAGK